MVISVIGQFLTLACCAVSLTFISQSLVEDSDVVYRGLLLLYMVTIATRI